MLSNDLAIFWNSKHADVKGVRADFVGETTSELRGRNHLRACGSQRNRQGSGQLVEKEIKGGNPAVAGNDEISPGVSGRLTRAARYPLDSPAIAQFLGRGNWLISKVRVSSPDHARDAIDLVAAIVDAPIGVVEHAIF